MTRHRFDTPKSKYPVSDDEDAVEVAAPSEDMWDLMCDALWIIWHLLWVELIKEAQTA